jgi:hypothetical protein
MGGSGQKVYRYSVTVTYRDAAGRPAEESFPVVAADRAAASDLACAWVLQVMKLRDFELRIVGG